MSSNCNDFPNVTIIPDLDYVVLVWNSNIVPSLYLSGTNCVASCPTGRYANVTNNECTLCVSPCSTCTTATSCLSCTATYSYFQTSCSLTCLSGYVSISQVCLPCTTPCGTCIITQTNCTSCLSSLSPSQYFIGSSCVITCPDTYYGNVSTLACTSCISPCMVETVPFRGRPCRIGVSTTSAFHGYGCRPSEHSRNPTF